MSKVSFRAALHRAPRCVQQLRVLALLFMALLCGGGVVRAIPNIADLSESNSAYLVFEKGDVGGAFFMHFVSFVKNNDGTPVLFNGQMRAYYIKTDTRGKLGIGLATTPDGINFTDQGLVLGTSASGFDSGMASFPGVFYEGGTTYLVYEANGPTYAASIGLATSTNGVNFTKKPNPILIPQGSGWEAIGVGTPKILKAGSTWYLHYHGAQQVNAGDYKIGIASGTSLTALTRSASNPIINTGASGWDSGTAGHRDIIQEGGNWYMVYEGSTDAPFDTAKWSLGFARSASLLGGWTKTVQQNASAQTDNTFGNDGPSLLKLNGRTWIYYRRYGNKTWRALINDGDNSYFGLPQGWNAQSAALGHTVGRADGTGWKANIAQDVNQGWLSFGPYNTGTPAAANPLGNNNAVWLLSIDNNTADNSNQVRLEVVDYDAGGQVVASRIITRRQFKVANHPEWFYVPFNWDASRAGHRMEMRVWWYRAGAIKLQTLGISSF